MVTSREGRVSRNADQCYRMALNFVTSREGRVSRNKIPVCMMAGIGSHVPRGTCE